MRKVTHLAIGTAATIPIIISNPMALLGILGATAPDLDYQIGLKHRTITHSIIALTVTSIPLILINLDVGLVWLISYGLHLVADSFTLMGVPFFYPWDKKYYGAKLFKALGDEDYIIMLLTVMFIIIAYVM